ncbi:MAG TPA: DUF1844 domain-containing protein [Candidatus Binatia bacterium]
MSEREVGNSESLHAAERREGEEKPAFRVIDRRRFAPDGSERADDEPQSPSSGSDAGAQSTSSREERAQAAGSAQSSSSSAQGPELAMPKGEPYEPGDIPEPTFSTLVISLSTQALMYLGEIPPLEGGEARKDLAAARNIIDLLAVLERKTTGNLDAGEAALLERVLYDLRMRFVAISRAS